MAPVFDHVAHLANVLATPEQLEVSRSEEDGVPAGLVTSMLFAGARLTQLAAILLRLPQDIAAQAIVLFTRFWIGDTGGSVRQFAVRDVSAASLYLVTKLKSHPKSLRSIANAYAYLTSFDATFTDTKTYAEASNAEKYFVSEGDLERQKLALTKMEMTLVQVLGFETTVALPHTLCINYLQTLGAFQDGSGPAIAKRAFGHLNAALLSPQLLYLTHQPSALATAAIYLAARELGVKLPGNEWWEVFDTDREELGFLVVGLLSMEGFVVAEREKWEGRKIPLTPEEMINIL